jgi:hypothetical protein
VLEKVGVSSSKNNARVVQTVRAKENPIGQFWEISALCPVEEVKI